jgi:hypothetical protein
MSAAPASLPVEAAAVRGSSPVIITTPASSDIQESNIVPASTQPAVRLKSLSVDERRQRTTSLPEHKLQAIVFSAGRLASESVVDEVEDDASSDSDDDDEDSIFHRKLSVRKQSSEVCSCDNRDLSGYLNVKWSLGSLRL